ncbi:MAG: hypothetical protein JSR99_17885 [Proteobacteria bacterium]|nr:hypothetical protein [Pseudomonadota bacterium]
MSDFAPDALEIEFAQTPNLRAKNPNFRNMRAPWSALAGILMANESWERVANKLDARAMTAGPLVGSLCTKKTVQGISLLISDHDDGWTMEESKALAEHLGHEAVIYPSFRNGATTIEILHDDFLKWAKENDQDPKICEQTARLYLKSTGKLRASHADVAVLHEGMTQTEKGFAYFLKTPPIDKHRVIRPLAKPIKFADHVSSATSHTDVLEAWNTAYKAALQAIGTPFDEACKDPSRRYFMPAHPIDPAIALPPPIHVRGSAYDLTPIFQNTLRGDEDKSCGGHAKVSQSDRGTKSPYIFKGFNLKAWAVQYARSFDIEAALERNGLVKDVRPSGGVYIECHQANHSGGVQQTFAQNGDGDKGFTLYCSGATGGCSDLDRLAHVLAYLESGQLSVADLEDQTIGGGQISNRAHRDAQKTREKKRDMVRVLDANGVGIDTARFVENRLSHLDFDLLNSLAKPGTQVGPGVLAQELAEHIRRENFNVEDLLACSEPPPSGPLSAELRALAQALASGKISNVEVTEKLNALKSKYQAGLNDLKKDLKAIGLLLEQEYSLAGVLSPIEASALTARNDYSAQYAVVLSGKTYVLNLHEPAIGKALVAHQDFKKIYKNDYSEVMTPKGPQTVFHAEEWLELPPPDAQFYTEGLVFKPTSSAGQNVSPNQYNLFSGFLIDPDPSGSCDLFYKLLRDVWVQGNEELLNWVAEFFMHPLRFPGDKIGTSIAIRGTHGDGKSIVTEQLMAPISGDMLLRVTNQKMVLGDYNEALSGKLLVALEEAAFAGDKQAFARLKELVTGRDVLVNPKHKSPITIDNYARMIIISNQRHFMNIEPGDRRYTVLNSVPAWAGTNLFEALTAEWNNGGAARFVYEALNHEFRKLEDRESLILSKKIVTDHQVTQQSESREPIEAFVVAFMLRGNFSAADFRAHLDLGSQTNGSDFSSHSDCVWNLDAPLAIESFQIEDAAADYFKSRAPAKLPHGPSLKSIIATMEQYYGSTKPKRRSIGKGNKAPTVRELPRRGDALIHAFKCHLITDEEFRSAMPFAVQISKVNAYAALRPESPAAPDEISLKKS